MRDNTYVYPYSRYAAKKENATQQYQESYKLNALCANAIKENIDSNDYTLSHESAKEVIADFGYDRVNYVLSNTLQQLKHDDRFSKENRDWSKDTNIPVDKVGTADRRKDFIVSSHPAVLNGFINQARQEYQNLKLWENKHCNSTIGLDFVEKIMVLHPSVLQGEFKTNNNQLIYCTSGFGCSPTATGGKVSGIFLTDGEDCQFYRSHFIGELKEEHHSQWLSEKLEQMGIVYVNLETKENQLLELILNTLDEQQQQDFTALIEERNHTSTAYRINMALAVKDEFYTIYRDVTDDVEIGKRYIQEEHSTLDDIIVNNLDFDGIGISLAADGGQMTEVGFILECDKRPEFIYKSSEIDTMLKEYEPNLEQTQGQIPTM